VELHLVSLTRRQHVIAGLETVTVTGDRELELELILASPQWTRSLSTPAWRTTSGAGDASHC
jgi:hypothetical protein